MIFSIEGTREEDQGQQGRTGKRLRWCAEQPALFEQDEDKKLRFFLANGPSPRQEPSGFASLGLVDGAEKLLIPIFFQKENLENCCQEITNFKIILYHQVMKEHTSSTLYLCDSKQKIKKLQLSVSLLLILF
jgi:hypothetical protein